MKLLPAPRIYTIRAIEPEDRVGLARFYEGLSPESRQTRFHGTGPRPGSTVCTYFCGPDHAHREGLVAVSIGGARQEVIGHLCLEPVEPGVVEMAVAVSDAWQRRGVGRALLAAAIAWAQEHGIGCLTASMLAGNAAVVNLVRSSGWPVTLTAADGGSVEARIAVGGALPHAA